MLRIRDGNASKTMTATPSKYPQGSFKDKPCGWCGEDFKPNGPSHKYCGTDCKSAGNSDKYYQKQYGVGLRDVEAMYQEQNGKCAICDEHGFKMRDVHTSGLNLDHCHTTGKVRGLLCHNCNRAIGLLQDDTERMRRAIDYVSK